MKITEPGLVADLPNQTYHEQTDWVSSTTLKSYLPERYKQGGSQDALDFGTLFHTAVLEPDQLDGYVALDATKIGVKADGSPAQNPTMTGAWKRAVAEAQQDGKTVIAQDWLDKALAMRDAVQAHDTAAALLYQHDGTNEESAFAVVDGVPCRARFDRRIPGAILDLKSSSAKPGKDSITRTVIDYGYDLSAAHYLTVAAALGLDAEGFGLIFVAKEAPHYVTVVDLDATFLARGRALRALAIDRHLNRTAAYEGASGYLTLDCPRWAEMETVA